MASQPQGMSHIAGGAIFQLMEKILHRLWCPKCCFYTSKTVSGITSGARFFHQPYHWTFLIHRHQDASDHNDYRDSRWSQMKEHLFRTFWGSLAVEVRGVTWKKRWFFKDYDPLKIGILSKNRAGFHSRHSWMYLYQPTPMGNPYISPIYSGYL